MNALYMILGTLVALGVLVTFHEFGHFWVARRCGVKVLRFSVGFGTPLLRWHDRHGTEFVVAAIPLGGYVKMLDEREGEVPAELLDQSFNRKPVRQRIAIVAAGPIANFLLALLFFWVLAMLGSQQVRPVIGMSRKAAWRRRPGWLPGRRSSPSTATRWWVGRRSTCNWCVASVRVASWISSPASMTAVPSRCISWPSPVG